MSSYIFRTLLGLFVVATLVSCMADQRHDVSEGAKVPQIDKTQNSQTQTQPDSQTSLGTMDGGGGAGVVCRDGEKIKSVELLDLYEAQTLRKLKPLTALKDVESEWVAFTQRFIARQGAVNEGVDYSKVQSLNDLEKLIGPPGQRMIEQATPAGEELRELYIFKDDFITRQRFSETPLRRIDDTREAFTPPAGCKLEQIINYQPDDTILINKTLWQELSIQGRAALMAHEYIYREYRKMGAKNSVQARKVVGILFSQPDPETVVTEKSSFGIQCENRSKDKYGSVTLIPGERGRDPSEIVFNSSSEEILVEHTGGEFEDVMMAENIKGEFKSLEVCRNQTNEEKISIESDNDASMEVQTSYFHDSYKVSYKIECEKKGENLNFVLSLKNIKSGDEKKYDCTGFDIP